VGRMAGRHASRRLPPLFLADDCRPCGQSLTSPLHRGAPGDAADAGPESSRCSLPSRPIRVAEATPDGQATLRIRLRRPGPEGRRAPPTSPQREPLSRGRQGHSRSTIRCVSAPKDDSACHSVSMDEPKFEHRATHSTRTLRCVPRRRRRRARRPTPPTPTERCWARQATSSPVRRAGDRAESPKGFVPIPCPVTARLRRSARLPRFVHPRCDDCPKTVRLTARNVSTTQ
jgi:hypothetical protein